MAKPATPTSKTPPKKLSSLEALRERLKKVDTGGQAGFWNPPAGKSTIRILPPTKDMEFFFSSVGRHFFPNRKYAMCPKFCTDGELPCPICEITDQLYKGTKADRELAKELARKKSFWMNVVVRDKNGDHGPYIWSPGPMAFGQIINLINDVDYGEVYDVDAGYDLTIEKTGEGLKTEYSVLPRPKQTPLSDDPDEAEGWLNDAKDLALQYLTEDPDEDKDIIGDHVLWISTYNRLIDEFDLENAGDMSASDYESSSAEPAQAPARKRRQEPKDDEDEGAEEPPAPPARRRVASPSTRR